MFESSRSALTLLMCLAPACYSATLLQEPEPLAPGQVRGGLGISTNVDDSAAPGQPRFGPEAGLRVGLPHDLELRAKLNVVGAEAGINARVYDGKIVDLMLMPSYASARAVLEDRDKVLDEEFPPEHELRAFVMPTIAKIELHPKVDLFLGPDIRAGRRDGQGWFALAGHAGFALSLGKYVSMIPECAWTQVLAAAEPIRVSEDGYTDIGLARGDTKVQCGLGFTMGGRHAALRRPPRTVSGLR